MQGVLIYSGFSDIVFHFLVKVKKHLVQFLGYFRMLFDEVPGFTGICTDII